VYGSLILCRTGLGAVYGPLILYSAGLGALHGTLILYMAGVGTLYGPLSTTRAAELEAPYIANSHRPGHYLEFQPQRH
jgi:hypothetical protein